jgi:hypothetical protein
LVDELSNSDRGEGGFGSTGKWFQICLILLFIDLILLFINTNLPSAKLK